jgi:MYXO-CTERM domain-containing protein
MKIKATPFGMLSLVLLALPVANAAVVSQTNFGTGDGTTPGGAFVSAGNLLATNLSSAASTGTFYGSYSVVLSRLYDGNLGSLGSADLGLTGNFTVMPNVATLQFDLNGAFNLTTIRTYASWSAGRDGQKYVVKYATAAAPGTFTTLHSVSAYDNANFPTESREVEDDSGNGTGVYEEVPITDTSSTLVTLTEDSTGVLAENVVSLQFVFDVYYQDGRGYENGGTAFREFQVLGTSVSSVPEPGTFLPAALLVAGAWLRRRRPRNHRSSGAAA